MKEDLFLSKALTNALKKEVCGFIEARAFTLDNGRRRVSMKTDTGEEGVASHSHMTFEWEVDIEELISKAEKKRETLLNLIRGNSSIRISDATDLMTSRWTFENPEESWSIPFDELFTIAREETESGRTTKNILTSLLKMNLSEAVAEKKSKKERAET